MSYITHKNKTRRTPNQTTAFLLAWKKIRGGVTQQLFENRLHDDLNPPNEGHSHHNGSRIIHPHQRRYTRNTAFSYFSEFHNIHISYYYIKIW